jgi:hypothetical protein
MCTLDGSGCALAAPGGPFAGAARAGGFASVGDALRAARAAAAYLNSPPAAELTSPLPTFMSVSRSRHESEVTAG